LLPVRDSTYFGNTRMISCDEKKLMREVKITEVNAVWNSWKKLVVTILQESLSFLFV